MYTNRITRNLHFRIARRRIILRTQISYKYWKKHHVAIEQALTYSCTSLPLESRGGGWRALRAYEKEGRDVENIVQEQTQSFLKRKSPTHVPDLCFKHGVGSDRPSHQSVRHPQSIPVRFPFLPFKWLAWESHWTLSWSLEQGISLLKRESFGQFPLVPP